MGKKTNLCLLTCTFNGNGNMCIDEGAGGVSVGRSKRKWVSVTTDNK